MRRNGASSIGQALLCQPGIQLEQRDGCCCHCCCDQGRLQPPQPAQQAKPAESKPTGKIAVVDHCCCVCCCQVVVSWSASMTSS
jgi:hypothetical protein